MRKIEGTWVGPLAAVLLLFAAAPPAPLSAQGAWTETTTMGFGALGLVGAVRMYVGTDEGQGPPALVPVVVVGALTFLGYRAGSAAETSAREGRPLGSGALLGTRIGTPTLFGLAGFALGIWIGGGNSDTASAAGMAAGLVAGAIVQRNWERGAAAALRPTVGLSRNGGARVGLSLHIPAS